MALSRRNLLRAGLVSTMLGSKFASGFSLNAPDELPAPKYQIAMNLELMFPREMAFEDRIEAAARCGAKHYGFWGHPGKNLDAMLEMQQKHGMTCASISGNPWTGWSTGLTKTGDEQAFLEDFEATCEVARRFGAKNLITFTGPVQKDIPFAVQEQQIVAGLKKAGAIAEKDDTYLTLEPLNRVESPQMTMLTAADAYRYAAGAKHPRIKVDFDIYHRALGEGNVLNTLEEGLKNGHVRFIEVGDVPGRKEPGTGETNYANIFAFLRRKGFDGLIGMEHGSSGTPQLAWDRVKSLAGL